jgi:outer membrane lipoprotein SlyB
MEQSVRTGAVEDVRDVRSWTNSGAGATTGDIAGSTQEGVTGKPGLEVTVKLDNGAMVAVVQNAGGKFSMGDRVQILSGNAASRVTH